MMMSCCSAWISDPAGNDRAGKGKKNKDISLVMDVAAMYQCSKDANEYSMVFSASFANVDRVCRHIDEFLRQHGLKHSFVVELGAREIMNNAIIHGSGKDPLKNVGFRISLQGNHLYLRSSDQGKGYKPYLMAQRESAVLKASGYGLAILHRYFDSVSFNEAGNEITLELKNFNASRGV